MLARLPRNGALTVPSPGQPALRDGPSDSRQEQAVTSSDPLSDRPTESRSLAARIAAAERWGRCQDRTAETLPARRGLRAKYARQVDPEGKFPPDELERRVDSLMHAHMLRMSLAAKKARESRTKAERRNP